MIRWRFNEPSPLRDLFEEMLDEHRRRQGTRGTPMPINLYDDGARVVIEAALPGVPAEKVDIDCTEGLLTIRASAEIVERQYTHQELHPVEYLRQVVLPAECRFDQAAAEFENGILTISVPKVQPRQPESIRIQVTRKAAGPETIEAKPGSGYKEVRSRRSPPTGGPPRKKPGGA